MKNCLNCGQEFTKVYTISDDIIFVHGAGATKVEHVYGAATPEQIAEANAWTPPVVAPVLSVPATSIPQLAPTPAPRGLTIISEVRVTKTLIAIPDVTLDCGDRLAVFISHDENGIEAKVGRRDDMDDLLSGEAEEYGRDPEWVLSLSRPADVRGIATFFSALADHMQALLDGGPVIDQ